MKKLRMMLMATMILGTFLTTAQATSQEDADTLNILGLFQGTDRGYELGRTATREEAVTMLVRFLGKETAARAREWETPFADVPTWAKPYVGYAYSNGLVQGTGATTFGVGANMDTNQYATLLLRTLGYTSGKDGDFIWNKAAEFAAELGMKSSKEDSTVFTRGDMVEISRAALDRKDKAGESTLLEKLLESGTVTKEAARMAGVLAAEPIFKDGNFFVPVDATFGYVRQVYPTAARMIWAFEELEEVFNARRQEYDYFFDTWEAIPTEKRYCRAISDTIPMEIAPICAKESDTVVMGFNFSLEPLPEHNNYGFLIDENYKILAYCGKDMVSRAGSYWTTTWPRQEIDCLETVNEALKSFGTVQIAVDEQVPYRGWDDGTGMSYNYLVTADKSVDFKEIRYCMWSYSDPAKTIMPWTEDELRGCVHYILHNDYISKSRDENGTVVGEESQHFGSYSALEYIEEADAWSVYHRADKPLHYFFYTEDGKMLCEFFQE